MAWQNRNQSQVAQDEPGLEYPFIQWVNRGGDLDPRRKVGGWFMPEESVNLLDAMPTGAEAAALNFSNSDQAAGVFIPALTVAPLLTRFTWVTKVNGRPVYSATYSERARGKLNLLAYVQTEDGLRGPVFITLTGTISKDLGEAFNAHRQRVRLATKGAAPAPLFTMTLTAGAPVMRGQGNEQSQVTPIVLVNDFDVDAAYVGDEQADEIEARWDEFKAWTAKWKDAAPLPDNAPEEPEDPDPATAPSPAAATTKPAALPSAKVLGDLAQARDRWSAAWNGLKKLGITTAFMNPAHNAAQLHQAAEAMQTALADLHAGADAESVKSALAIQLAQI